MTTLISIPWFTPAYLAGGPIQSVYTMVNNCDELDFKIITSNSDIDELPLKKGLWRMTSNDNYAYHMGNTFEEWMQETLDGMPANDVKNEFLLTYPEIKNSSKIDYFIKNRLFIKLFNKKRLRRFFYKIKVNI